MDARVEDVGVIRVDRTEVLHDADLADADLGERAEDRDDRDEHERDAHDAESDIRIGSLEVPG